MTFVQAHKAMRHLAYRLAKGALSDEQLVGLFTPQMLPCHAHIHTGHGGFFQKLLKFSEWPTLEEMKAGRSTTLNDTSDEGEEDETADEKSFQNPTVRLDTGLSGVKVYHPVPPISSGGDSHSTARTRGGGAPWRCTQSLCDPGFALGVQHVDASGWSLFGGWQWVSSRRMAPYIV
jgi:hypothetical protein